MRIYSVSNNNNYNVTFGVNLQSKKLRFDKEDFFVRIKGYGHDSEWAEKICETADTAVDYIREKCNFEETLKKITVGVREANQLSEDLEKRDHTGILRIERDGWKHESNWGDDLITTYSSSPQNRYRSYASRLDYTVKHPLDNPYKIELTRPIHDVDFGKFMRHGSGKYIHTAFFHINKIFNKLYDNYILHEVKKENLDKVNSDVAEIRWILAHVTPWERGSDAISNTFIRSVYKAMGIKLTKLKKGVSLDLEAYCTNLEDYKNKFAKYFSKKPKIIN